MKKHSISAFAPLVLGGLAPTLGLQTAILLCAIPFAIAGITTLFLPSTEALRARAEAEAAAAAAAK